MRHVHEDTVDTQLPASFSTAQSPSSNEATKDVAAYARLIRDAQGRAVENFLAMAGLISDAKNNLDHTGFRDLARMLGTSASTLCKFATIDSRRDRFVGREQSLPPAWTVVYELSKLTDGQYETISASEKLRPELTEREIKRFVAQNEAANDVSRSASDEMACLAVRIVFPAVLSLQQEDEIKKKIFDALDGDPALAIRVSQRRKFKATRR
jgi:hypothetical protein